MVRVLKINRMYRKILGYLAIEDPTSLILKNTGLKEANYYKKLTVLEKYGYITKKRVGKILNIQLQPRAVKELGMTSVGDKKIIKTRPQKVQKNTHKNNKLNSKKNSKPRPPPIKNQPRPPPPMISIGNTKKKVLQLLSEGGNPHSISKKINKHRATIQQHLKELKTIGFVYKNNFLWFITSKGKSYLGGGFNIAGYEESPNFNIPDRAHNLKIKYEVRQKPDHMEYLKGWKINDKIKNNVFYIQKFGEIVTTYTGRNIIFQLPSLLYKNSNIAIAEAGRIGQALKQKYEAGIPGLKLGGKEVTAQLISQHHAIVGDPYAKFLQKHGISYKDELIDLDASTGKAELEFTDKEESHIHHEAYTEYIKDIILKEPPKISELANILQETQKQIHAIAIGQANLTQQLQIITNFIVPKPLPNIKKTEVSYIG